LKALLGPAFETVIVYVMFDPTTGLLLLTVFVRLRSAFAEMDAFALLELLPGTGSGVKLEAFAIFTIGSGEV
jgi:hypothetical protein